MRLFVFGGVQETDPLKIVNNSDPIKFVHKTKESVRTFGVELKCPFFIYPREVSARLESEKLYNKRPPLRPGVFLAATAN